MAATPSSPEGSSSIVTAFTRQTTNQLEGGAGAFDQAGQEVEAPSKDVPAQIVRNLARQISYTSISSRRNAEPLNPFQANNTDPQLDPISDKFSAKAWVKSMLTLQSRDPERYPLRTAGVSFTNLNVHGYGSPTDYQKTVGNIWFHYLGRFKRFIGVGKKLTKIRILRDFEGLVKPGEMLVVLGRPGR
jgi:hypothetical protein